MAGYEELNKLTEEIQKLNKHLDERVHTLEEQQAKTELKISQGGPIAAEARQELEKINAKISGEIKDYKKLVAENKENMLASQRPPVAGGYPGSMSGSYKPPATKALEKWMRKGGKSSAVRNSCSPVRVQLIPTSSGLMSRRAIKQALTRTWAWWKSMQGNSTAT